MPPGGRSPSRLSPTTPPTTPTLLRRPHPHHPHPQQPPPLTPPTPPTTNPNRRHRDPDAPHGGYSVGPSAGAGAGACAGGGLVAYYYERIRAEPHGFAVKEAIRQYGADPVGYGAGPTKTLPTGSCSPTTSCCTPSTENQPNYERGTKKGSKTTKGSPQRPQTRGKAQEKSTETTRVDHIKTQRAQATTKPVEKKEAPVSDKGKAASSKRTKRKETLEEDLETKKRKIIEGGTEPNKVKICTICNVVVNSQKVYDLHVAVSKHVAMVMKQHEAATS